MRPDPGRVKQESLIASMSSLERTRQTALLRERGMWMAWQQVDQNALDDPLQQAEFILRRLYPEMPEVWFQDVLAKLAAKHAAGEWNGFERPR